VINRNLMEEGPIQYELYNLQEDPQEQNNVADEHPEVIDKAKSIFAREHTPAEIERFRMAALADE